MREITVTIRATRSSGTLVCLQIGSEAAVLPREIGDMIADSVDEAVRRLRVRDEGLLERVERETIERAIAAHPTLKDAASALGIGKKTLWVKRKKYNLA